MSYGEALAEADNDVRRAVLIEIGDDGVEGRVVGLRQNRVLARHTHAVLLGQLAECLNAARPVILWNIVYIHSR